MPVGTKGTMKGITSRQMEELGCRIMLSNTYHLAYSPGGDFLKEAGGLHKFMNWKRNILTDSGGFQMVSLAKLSEVTEKGVTFESPYDKTMMFIGPEESIRVQNQIGSDIMMALDDVAIMKDVNHPDGLPMLASVAQQQGSYMAKANMKKLQGKDSKPFVYQDNGTMATVGRNKAVVDLSKFKFGGFFAWVTWLFVHLMLLVDFRNRLIVFSNWVWSYVNFDRGTRLIVRRYKRPETKRKAKLKATPDHN